MRSGRDNSAGGAIRMPAAPAAAAVEQQTDVVVVGGGGAGLAAAVAAASRGVDTVLLEKAAELGGTTRLSVGSFSAAGTPLQRRAGIRDAADDFVADMAAFSGPLTERDNPRLRAMLAAEAATTLRWLEGFGIAFAGPFPEPPNRVSRMHNVIPGSRMYVARLCRAARRLGVTMRLGASAEQLVIGGDGRVAGVDYVESGGGRCRLIARRGVILATGDFSGSQRLRDLYLSPPARAAIPINPQAGGEGHELARRAGAAFCNMDAVFGPQLRFPRSPQTALAERLPDWPWLARLGAQIMMRAPSFLLKPLVKSLLIANMSPSERLFQEGAVLIDLDGRVLDPALPAIALAAAREATGYIVLDARIARLFDLYPNFISTAPGIAYAYFRDYARGRPDIVHRGASVEALASAIAVPPAALRTALAGLGGGTLFALGPVHAMLTVTEGSVAVDEECRVLTERGKPIDALYAAGGVGQGGMLLKGHGLHIAWAMTSGRVAGEMAARRLPVEVGGAEIELRQTRSAAPVPLRTNAAASKIHV